MTFTFLQCIYPHHIHTTHPPTHQVLHHLHPLAAEVADGTCNVHNLLLLDLVQDSVDGDQSPRPTHTSTVRERVACKNEKNSHEKIENFILKGPNIST